MPHFYDQMIKYPGCKEMHAAGNLKFVMGHTHCNVPHPHNHTGEGFMVAGQGMEGCGNFGVPVFDTTSGRTRVFYFETETDAKYNSVLECVSSKGWRRCLDHATIWLDQARTSSKVIV